MYSTIPNNRIEPIELGCSIRKIVLKTDIKGDVVEAEYLTPEQLAHKLQVPLRTIQDKTYRNLVPGQVRVFGRWRYRKIEVEKALLRGQL